MWYWVLNPGLCICEGDTLLSIHIPSAQNFNSNKVLVSLLYTEASVPPGPTAIQSQRNTQRLILIINCLAC